MASKKSRTTKTHSTTHKTSKVSSIKNTIGKKGGATIAAGAVGAMVGAAAGVMLSDDKTRAKAINAAGTFRSQAVDILDETAKQTEKVQKATKKMAKTAKQ